MAFLPGVIKAVLENEVSDTRFESFCVDLYSKAEGIEIVPTSRTKDYGRDGRSALLRMSSIRPILCATIRKDIDQKVKEDILRLKETSATNFIVYFSSKELTEGKVDSIKLKIKELYPDLQDALVMGQVQIIRLIERHEEIFSQYYQAEISNIEDVLLKYETVPDIKAMGLLLSLCTQVGEDARELRVNISRHLVLHNLHNKAEVSLSDLSTIITGQLHLPKAISPIYMREIAEQLQADSYLTISDDNKIEITELGKEFITCIPEEAITKLLEGRIAVREAIKNLSGHILSDPQFNKLWTIFQDGLTELFYLHGMSIVRIIRTILIERLDSKQDNDFYHQIDDLATRSVASFSSSEQADEVKQALIDMFSEKESPAFKWLTQICCTYLMMCSLGLEELSNRQILNILSTYHIIPDSDIVISVLCEGESNHEVVERILKGWKAIGGTIKLSTPVLEEVAYHAWISERDYVYYGNSLSTMSDEDANHAIENAFVRTFRKLSKATPSPSRWVQYISQFRGQTETDYSHIIHDLKVEYNAELLTKTPDKYGDFASKVTRQLLEVMSKWSGIPVEDLDSSIRGKLLRDGLLVASVLAERDSRKEQGDFTTSCILSSAATLKNVDFEFRTQLGPPEMILSTAAVGFLLTLCPQVSMGFGTLKSVLFDSALTVRLTQAQHYAFRVIAASGQWDVPWARRASLQRHLQSVLYQEARAKGERISTLRKEVFSNKDPEYSANIVSQVLDSMAISPKSQEKLIKTLMENQRLQEELDSIRKRAKTPSPKTISSRKKIFRKKK